jgi:predicted alpha/beta hydrolase family esterase
MGSERRSAESFDLFLIWRDWNRKYVQYLCFACADMMLPDFSRYRVLIVPGLHGSGPEHWQTRWQQLYPAFERVEQDDWTNPDLPTWSRRLCASLLHSQRPTLIVAHSFGCLTALHTLHTFPSLSVGRHSVAAALLVAPADPKKFGVTSLVNDVCLSCPSMVIGSENDPWMGAARAVHWAKRWGSDFVNVGSRGHINGESGLGDWADGLHYLASMADTASVTPSVSY